MWDLPRVGDIRVIEAMDSDCAARYCLILHVDSAKHNRRTAFEPCRERYRS